MPRARVGQADRVTVIGLGRFGSNLARTLHELGYDVTAIDLDERTIQDVSEYVALAAQGDGTDEDLLRSLQVERSDVVIVAYGSIEASLIATLLLKRLGARWVISKASNALHGDLLARIGANRVVFPERDDAIRLAHALAVPSITDYISLTPSSGVAKFTVPDHFAGRTLADMYAAHKANLAVLLIKRRQTVISSPASDERIQAGDELVVVGPDIAIEAFVETKPDEDGA
ncbi:MAG: potassium channel family protein [Thermomicrobiales bacterium]